MLIETSLQDHVLTLTLNRPPVNSFDRALSQALGQALRAAARQNEARVIVLTGSGRAFSAGQDLVEMSAASEQKISYREHLFQTYNPLILQLRALPKVVIAALNGPAAGAGLGLALACDLRVAHPAAYMTVGFNKIGLAPDSGVSLLLPILIGLGRAAEVTLSNRRIMPEEALQWGLLNRIFSAEHFAEETQSLAAELARGPVRAYELTKRTFNKAMLPHLSAVLDYEAHIQEIARTNPEHQEGLQAFFEKRLPNFLKAAS